MPDKLIAIAGTTFALARRNGDIIGGVEGLYTRDARFISRWRLTVDGRTPRLLTSHHVDAFSNLCFLASEETDALPPNALSIARRRVVGEGMEEEIEIECHSDTELGFEVRLEVGADFLDLFEVKAEEFTESADQVFAGGGHRQVTAVAPHDGVAVEFAHRDGRFSAAMQLRCDPAPDAVEGSVLAWRVKLSRHRAWRLKLKVGLRLGEEVLAPTHALGDFGAGVAALRGGRDAGVVVPQLRTSWDKLYQAYRRSIHDLDALLISDPGLPYALPAAGLPWFMTVFGRDTLITSYQLLPGGLPLAWGALETLARLQATEVDDDKDAQPGRIVHELRRGPVAVNGRQFPYYGSIDAPMLFLVLLSEAYRWSADDAAARALRPAAEAILGWMEAYGDLDGDGFIEYLRHSPKGLESQSWKDSWDAIRFHDGRIAQPPIATCEVQGYAYDGLRRCAELARGPWNDGELAARLDGRAKALYERFNEAYWSDARGGFYHLALDAEKSPVDSITSNLGHLLWSGIVPRERAGAVAAQLMGPDLFSGWGIRTMSSADSGFNPIGYHLGTVWPHDNSLAMAGLRRYGFYEEANRIWVAMMDAAAAFNDHRLPEAFAGFDQAAAPFPVEYPTASSPQAWAAGAVLLMLRSALGAEPDLATRSVRVDPHLPAHVHFLRLGGCVAFGRKFDIEVTEGTAEVTETHSPAA